MLFTKHTFKFLSFLSIFLGSFTLPSQANPLCEQRPFEIAVASGVSEANRYTEAAVFYLCENNIEQLLQLIDHGYVSRSDAYILADYLGVRFKSQPRSVEGRLYELVYLNLLDAGLCTACAANAASEYVESPDSYVGQLVTRVLEGDSYAIELLRHYHIQQN